MPSRTTQSEAKRLDSQAVDQGWAGKLERWPEGRRPAVYTNRNIDEIQQLAKLSPDDLFAIRAVSQILPFRVNEYVIEELIDWQSAPDDPIFRLTFPHRGMLSAEHFGQISRLLRRGAGKAEIAKVARRIREQLNPHPAGQVEMNLPIGDDGEVVNGLQHKYRETVLFFPREGQTCHSYCTFCFRWAQFVGENDFKIRADDKERLHSYLAAHGDVSDVLITGGDPMVMRTSKLRAYVEPLAGDRFEHIRTIRIGTKALTFWPHRFVGDADSDELLRLIERMVNRGKHVALMAHYNHWRELSTPVARAAIRRLRDAGAEIRSQGPLLRHINDDPEVWSRLWTTQVNLGIVPYYMFVERDTGSREYFELPLVRAWQIYREAQKSVSGLGRSARGPSMSAGPGKVEIQGVTEIKGEKVMALRFLQGRNPDWVQRPFFARYDEEATWLDQLVPAFGEERFFFEAEYEEMCARAGNFLPGKKLI